MVADPSRPTINIICMYVRIYNSNNCIYLYYLVDTRMYFIYYQVFHDEIKTKHKLHTRPYIDVLLRNYCRAIVGAIHIQSNEFCS